MLAFLNIHLPLTEAQRSLFRQPYTGTNHTTISDGASDLAAPSHDMTHAADQNRMSTAGKHVDGGQTHGQTDGLTAGDVVLGGLSHGSTNLSGRTWEFRVKAEERDVFEEVCKGHIAILELSL